MSKASDRIEWNYVKRIMAAFGFLDMWVSTIQNYISSISISLMINGKHCDYFLLYKGIRQGDPLSRTFSFCVRRGWLVL